MDPKKRLSFLMYCIPISFTNCNRFWWWIPKTVINRHVFYLCTFCTVITNYMWYIIILPFFVHWENTVYLTKKNILQSAFPFCGNQKRTLKNILLCYILYSAIPRRRFFNILFRIRRIWKRTLKHVLFIPHQE